MKIRRGFVTNSSSSSYIIAKKKDATLADIKNSLLKVRDNAKSFLIEQHKWIDLEPDVEESIRKEDYDKAVDAFLEHTADYLYGNFNDGTLGDWEVGSDEFWSENGDPYENFILDSAWFIGDENLQII